VLRLVKGWVLAMLVPPVKNGRPCAWLRSRRADKRGAFDQVGRVRQAARLRKQEKFTALLHHVSVETLSVAFYALKRKAAPGVDGVTWQDYEADLERKLVDLHSRIHRGAYRPQPSRRTYIPKADGAQVIWLWLRSLRRRSQKDGSLWERIAKLANDYLPKPRILHPWPNVRFAAKHPR